MGLAGSRRLPERGLPRGLQRGLREPHGRLYPNPAVLVAAREAGIPITTASDAHDPQDVGRDIDRAIDHAKAAGYETVTVFDQRRARQEPLG